VCEQLLLGQRVSGAALFGLCDAGAPGILDGALDMALVYPQQ
jgi:hypothetical protein